MRTGLAVKIFLIFLLLLLLLLAVRFFFVPRAGHAWPLHSAKQSSTIEQEPRHGPLEAAIFRVLHTLEVTESDIRPLPAQKDSVRRFEARIPKGHPIEWVAWRLSQSVAGTAYRIEDCAWDAQKKTCLLIFQSRNRDLAKVTLNLIESDRFFSATAKLAIIIDNFTFKADQTTTRILSFPDPLTLSLIPWDKKSSWTAQAAANYTKEIVIQLPLEPRVKVDTLTAKSMIFVHYSEEKIRGMLIEAMKIIPNFAGFNNLLGSRACEDSRVMRIILEEVGKRHGYFVETQASRNSVIATEAGKATVPYAAITASIAESADEGEIEDLLRHYCVVAQNKGSLLVSVKATPALVSALIKVRPLLTQNGVRLVYVSEIVSHAGGK
jgi:polysaccharide deacetylase 2 family uncharacterized protein YibQ